MLFILCIQVQNEGDSLHFIDTHSLTTHTASLPNNAEILQSIHLENITFKRSIFQFAGQ